MATILITGGSGLIGKALTSALIADGHSVRHLSRSRTSAIGVPIFQWNVAERTVDPHALEGVDHIIHLAGTGIADRRWRKARVRELISSRTDSARLLLERTKAAGVVPKSFVSASGMGYYAAKTTDHVCSEDDAPGTDTIARISVEWEKAVDEWTTLCRVVKLRTPVVLAREGGALPKLTRPVRWCVGAALGRGDQWMPWVHIDDLVRAYERALFNAELSGAYNIVGGNATNAEVMRTVARVLKKPFFLPNVPGPAMKLALGELSSILLEGSRVNGDRMRRSGFKFMHQDLEAALRDLLVR